MINDAGGTVYILLTGWLPIPRDPGFEVRVQAHLKNRYINIVSSEPSYCYINGVKIEEEYFPIYKILFEVLMGKGPFYDFVSGEVGSEVERNFHYPMEYDKTIKDRNNPLFYWVNGDKRLRDAFYDYFAKGEILEVKDWIVLLEDILKGAK